MKMFGSRIASIIDNEFKAKERVFRKKYCKYCINQDTDLCEIRTAIDRQLKCVYYEKGDK